MKRILAAAALFVALASPAFAQTQIPGGGGGGVTSITCGGTTITTSGNCGALTGDVTAAAGSGVTTLANIPAISGANLTSLNASNIGSGTLAAARGGAGTITGALKANGAGVVSQAACADLSNAAASCSTDTTNATNIASGTLADARLTANVPLLNAANTFTAKQLISGASFGLTGNISAPAWTTAGIRYANTAGTLTDTTSSGTVAAARTDSFGGNTIAASSATTFTNYYTGYWSAPAAGTNVTFTNKWALGADSLSVGTSGVFNVSSAGVLTTTSPVLTTPTLGVASGTSLGVTGTAGAGYVEFGPQSAQPSTPAANTFRLFANSAGKFTWIGANGFLRIFDGTTNTADRTYTLPDVTGTMTVLGNASTGSGSVVLATSPSLTTPTLGVATGTSLALGGATIGTDALGVTGTSSLGSKLTLNGNGILTSPSAATLQHGAADVDTAPVAQTIRTQGALAGGTSNVAGANLTVIVSPGKGTGAGGSFIVQTAPAGSTGTVVNAPVTALTIDSTGLATFAKGITSSSGDITSSGRVIVGTASEIRFNGRGRFASPADGQIELLDTTDADFNRLQFGGTTSSYPSIKRSTTSLKFRLADDSADTAITASNVTTSGAIIATGSTPTLTGTCTTGSQVGGNTAGSFTATCTAQTVIIGFATAAPNGWICDSADETTSADVLKQTGHTTTSCTLTGTTVAGDVIVFHGNAF